MVDLDNEFLTSIMQEIESAGEKNALSKFSKEHPSVSHAQLLDAMIKHIAAARRLGDIHHAERLCKAGIALTHADTENSAPYFVVFMAGLCELLDAQQRAGELDSVLQHYSSNVMDVCKLWQQPTDGHGRKH